MRRVAVAVVDETRCIGCTRCLEVCPVDAIVGARGLMHTVVEPWCIGCELCLPPCPVDCIDLVAPHGAWNETLKRAAGRRARMRTARKEVTVMPIRDRKAVLAAALARKRR